MGLKSKNPLNVKQTRPHDPWRGTIGVDSRGHVQFDDEIFGIRAAVRTLAAKYNKGKVTIAAIIADWAPASDTIGSIPGNPQNDPGEYAAFVAERMGWAVDVRLGLFEPSGRTRWPGLLIDMLEAMIEYENGVGTHLPMSKILHGIAEYYRDFVEGD